MQTSNSTNDIQDLRNDELEQAVVATFLVEPDLFDKHRTKIEPDLFFNYTYQKMIKAMHELRDKNISIDFITVLNHDRTLKSSELADIHTNLPSDLVMDISLHGRHIEDHLMLLTELKVKREIYQKLQTGVEMDQVLANLEKLSRKGMDKFLNPKEIALEVLAILEQRKQGLRGIEYPIPMLNRATNGIQKGQLVIVAARPSVGKSTFLANIALRAGSLGKKILFASAEMTTEMIGLRIASQLLKKNLFYYESDTSPEETIRKLEKTNVYIHQFTSLSELEIKIKENYDDTDLVLVDYLQVMEPKTKYRSPYEKISNLINELVVLKSKYNIPLVVASQYNRVAERNQPTMADLRESGAIEQAADVIISLWNHNDDENTSDRKKVRIDLLKNRNGFTFGNTKNNISALWLNKRLFEFYEEEDKYKQEVYTGDNAPF